MPRTSRLVVTMLFLALAACSKPAEPSQVSSTLASVTQSSTAPASFKIDVLTQADNDIQGCQVSLEQPGGGEIFIEDGIDTGAHGYIRIDGARYRVDLTASEQDEKGGVRTFANEKSSLTLQETLKVGKAHEETDSVEQTGTLVITFKGVTQQIAVEGGTAC